MLLAPVFALVFLIRHKLRFSRKSMFFIFWMGLNDSYDHIIGQILIAEPLPSINKVCSLIL